MNPHTLGYKGNALLYALILITLFIVMAFGITTLIVQGARGVFSLENAYRGFYAAEGGVERALISLKHHFPGFEEEVNRFPLRGSDVSYSIVSRAERIPKEDQNFLFPHITKILALYKDVGTGDIVQIHDINVPSEYILLHVDEEDRGAVGCIEWSVFGFRTYGTRTVTESMGGCLQESLLDSRTATGSFKDTDGMYSSSYPLETFLATHTQNYLQLVYYEDTEPGAQSVSYALEFYGDAYADEYFTITSTGYVKNYRQTEQVLVPQGELFPAFYFAIFNSS